MPLVIRPAEKADRAALLSLFAVAFQAQADPADWEWKYDRNPCRAVSAVAVDDGRVLGFYGGFATRYRGAEGAFPGVSAVDVMTDPAARSLGQKNVFRLLGEGYCRLNAEMGVPFYFGFPHERHRILGERLVGYRSVGPAGQLGRPLARAGLLSRLRSRLTRVVRDTSFGAAHEPLAEALHKRPGWRSDRSTEVLNWRFGRPGVAYRVVQVLDRRGASRAYTVVRLVGERALLVDLQLADEASGSFGDLLDVVSADLAPLGTKRLKLRAPPQGLLARRAREEFGFVDEPSDSHFEVRPLDPAFDLDRASSAFDYRFLDHDIF